MQVCCEENISICFLQSFRKQSHSFGKPKQPCKQEHSHPPEIWQYIEVMIELLTICIMLPHA